MGNESILGYLRPSVAKFDNGLTETTMELEASFLKGLRVEVV
jgi:hypothetical protein